MYNRKKENKYTQKKINTKCLIDYKMMQWRAYESYTIGHAIIS